MIHFKNLFSKTRKQDGISKTKELLKHIASQPDKYEIINFEIVEEQYGYGRMIFEIEAPINNPREG